MELSVNDYRVETSARHVHLSKEDFTVLFGSDAKMNEIKPLSLRGEFKSDKTVTVLGPKHNLERVTVLGPFRSQTQVEISVTDSYILGVRDVPVRLSGDLQGAAPVTLVGPNGKLELKEGMIIAARHLHINAHDMQKFNLNEGQKISIEIGSVRKITLHNVVIRKSNVDFPIVHIDTDEANASC